MKGRSLAAICESCKTCSTDLDRDNVDKSLCMHGRLIKGKMTDCAGIVLVRGVSSSMGDIRSASRKQLLIVQRVPNNMPNTAAGRSGLNQTVLGECYVGTPHHVRHTIPLVCLVC